MNDEMVDKLRDLVDHLAFLRVAVQSLQHDLEATRREKATLIDHVRHVFGCEVITNTRTGEVTFRIDKSR